MRSFYKLIWSAHAVARPGRSPARIWARRSPRDPAGQTISIAGNQDEHLRRETGDEGQNRRSALLPRAPWRDRTAYLLPTIDRSDLPQSQFRAPDLAEHQYAQALASPGHAHASAVCHSICTHFDLAARVSAAADVISPPAVRRPSRSSHRRGPGRRPSRRALAIGADRIQLRDLAVLDLGNTDLGDAHRRGDLRLGQA